MRKLLLAAILLASCAKAVVAPTAAPTAPVAVAPAGIEAFAEAWCKKDAAYMADNIAGSLAAPLEVIQSYFDAKGWTCASVTYLGPFTGPDGSGYVFVLHCDDYDRPAMWEADKAGRVISMSVAQ